jgi:hypothetical protein
MRHYVCEVSKSTMNVKHLHFVKERKKERKKKRKKERKKASKKERKNNFLAYKNNITSPTGNL